MGCALWALSWNAAWWPQLGWGTQARDGQVCTPAAWTRCVGLKDGVGLTRAGQGLIGDTPRHPHPCVCGPHLLHPGVPGSPSCRSPDRPVWGRVTPGSVFPLQGPECSSYPLPRVNKSASYLTALSVASPQPRGPLGCGRSSQVCVGAWLVGGVSGTGGVPPAGGSEVALSSPALTHPLPEVWLGHVLQEPWARMELDAGGPG